MFHLLMTDHFLGNPTELFDIPAAEQEVTVGSNDQSGMHTVLPPSTLLASSTAGGSIIIENPISNTNQIPRSPRVIMVQRAGQPGAQLLSSATSRPALKTVKIITVPGQGAGGKPLKAAVIPMHMLQRSVKVVPSGPSTLVSSAQPSVVSMPRVVTIRSPSPFVSGANIMGAPQNVTAVRPGTLILSSPATPMVATIGGSYAHAEDIDNNMVTTVGTSDGMHAPHPGIIAPQPGGYYDLAIGLPGHGAVPGCLPPTSPTGHESGDEQEHMPTGLKTNGLRRYARCVCDKVKEKGITSYSEVADELVHEYAAEHPMIPSEQLHYIQKNIRRRVYDALNVLMALNVLQKEKKEIRWVGLPVNMIEECRRLEEEREKSQIALRSKTVEIQDLILQLIAFKNLIMRNRINDRYRRSQSAAEAQATSDGSQADNLNILGLTAGPSKSRTEKIPLPFLVISTHRKTVIDCNISSDKLEYLFNFDQAFEIRDEVDTLKRMGLMLRLGTMHCTQEEYNQCLELVPPSLRFYVEAIYERRQAVVPDFDALHQQRRLFVEARLTAAAANQSAGQTDDHGDRVIPRGSSMRNSQHSPVDHGSHYSSLFDTGVGCTSDTGLRQLYLSRSAEDDNQGRLVSGSGVVASSGFVPGDTQHYARAAASRGYVVPGGPGGLLRHRQHPSTQMTAGSISRPYVDSQRSLRPPDGPVGLIRPVSSATRAMNSRTGLVPSGVAVEDELVDDDEDDEDDEDMEDV